MVTTESYAGLAAALLTGQPSRLVLKTVWNLRTKNLPHDHQHPPLCSGDELMDDANYSNDLDNLSAGGGIPK